RPGENLLAIEVSKPSSPAGVIGRLDVEFEDGQTLRIDIDETWKASPTFEAGWERLGFDDATWNQAVPVAGNGTGPWREQPVLPKPEPAPYLRKAFTVERPLKRARLYATA